MTFHWNAGRGPPLTGTAVNVTAEPAQTGFALAEIVSLTGRFELTVMVIALEDAGLLLTQMVSEEVRIQVT